VAAALRIGGGSSAGGGGWGALGGGGDPNNAAAAAAAAAAVAELGTNANILLTRLQRIAAQRHAALMNKLKARGQSTRYGTHVSSRPVRGWSTHSCTLGRTSRTKPRKSKSCEIELQAFGSNLSRSLIGLPSCLT
jgi:hypothetical protein